MDKQIEQVRKSIDEIDDTIMALLDKRFQLTNQIGILKKQSSTQVLDTNREEIILNKTSNYSHHPSIKEIYKTIMFESKRLQRK